MNRNQMLRAMKEDIDRLTMPFKHIEKTDTGATYVGHHLSLFDQFRLEITESTKNKEDNGPKKPAASKPPMSDQHMEVLILIKRTIRDLGLLVCGRTARYDEETLRDVLTGCLKTDQATIEVCYQAIANMRRKLEQTLSWEIPPRKLNGQCPICTIKHKLLVYMDNYGPIYAICGNCNSRWDREVLGILAGSLERNTEGNNE
jgi:hypothetical protein